MAVANTVVAVVEVPSSLEELELEMLGSDGPFAELEGVGTLTAFVLPPSPPPPTITSCSPSSAQTTLLTKPAAPPTSRSKLPNCPKKLPVLTSRLRITSLFCAFNATATRSPARLIANDLGPIPPAENFWRSLGMPVLGLRENVTSVSEGEVGFKGPGGLSLSIREEMMRNLLSGYKFSSVKFFHSCPDSDSSWIIRDRKMYSQSA